MNAPGGELRTQVAPQLDMATVETMSALATLEAYAVTFLGVARQRGGELDLDAGVRRLLRTAQCEHEAHHSFWLVEGGFQQTSRFALDSTHLEAGEAILAALIDLTGLLQAAYQAAARFFAETWQFRYVEVATQVSAVEAQQQAVARMLAGETIPVDRAFAPWRFRAAVDAVAALDERGVFATEDDDEDTVTFPGPLERNCRGVSGLVPETVEDQM